MALIDHDAFDFIDWNTMGKRGWTHATTLYGASSFSISAGIGRGGSRAATISFANSSGMTLTRVMGANLTTFTWIAALYIDVFTNDFRIDFCEGGTNHLNLRCNSGGTVALYMNNTVLHANLFTVVPDTYQTWALSATIHDTTGSWSFSVDGAPKGSGTSVDTKNGLTGYVDNFKFSSGANGVFRVDDIAWYDTVVTHEDHRSETIMPTMDGAHVAWPLSTGGAGYAVVDEIPYSLTDFASTNTAGNKISFKFPTPTILGDINLISWRPMLRAAIGGVRTVRAFIRVGIVDWPHATTVTMLADDTYVEWRWTVNPATGVAFVGADFPLEIGLEVMA